MLHRTARALQRVTRRQSSGPQYGHIHGFRSQPCPLLTVIRSLHDDTDILPSSQEASHDPSHGPSFQEASPTTSPAPSSQSWYFDKINMLQTDMATTNLKIDHLKNSTNTQMSHLQTNIGDKFTNQIGILIGQISALDSKFDSKINVLDTKFDSKIDALDAKFDSKIDALDAKFDSKFNDLDNKLDSKFNAFTSKFDSKFETLKTELKH